MEERILGILEKLTAIRSVSETEAEKEAAAFLRGYIRGIPYFADRGEQAGVFAIEGDPWRRGVVWALVKGVSAKTVVLLGHYDVVDAAEPGVPVDSGFVDRLFTMTEKDGWIYGRGVADMKGGIAINLDFIEEYAEKPAGFNLLFVAVPDEEAFSLGARKMSALLTRLRDSFQLEYTLLIDTEPSRRKDGRHILSTGGAGKILPTILVQGKSVHAGECFSALNPVSVLAELQRETDLSPAFCDVCGNEASLPPVWPYLRGLKENYDATLPAFAAGYMSVLTFSTPPAQIMEKVRAATETAFVAAIGQIHTREQQYAALQQSVAVRMRDFPYAVFTWQEMIDYCKKMRGKESDDFLQKKYEKYGGLIQTGALNHPKATIEYMKDLVTFSGIETPLALIAFSAPIYPAMSSAFIENTSIEGAFINGQAAFFGSTIIEDLAAKLRAYSLDRYGIDIETERYDLSLSDISYTAKDRNFNAVGFAENAPLWGSVYEVPFAKIASLNIPSILLGPHGKAFHEADERVEKCDLCERIPALIRFAAETVAGGKQ
jgi:arginine utilization protein RocB